MCTEVHFCVRFYQNSFLTYDLNCVAMADMYDSDEEELTIENDAVLTKYKTAGEISNLVSRFKSFLKLDDSKILQVALERNLQGIFFLLVWLCEN